MPGIRHRKSLYCRHRQQLWGDKKGNWHYWGSWDLSLLVSLCVWTQRGEKEKEKKKKKRRRKPISRVGLSIHQCLSANRSVWKGGSSLNEQSGDWVQGCCGVGGVNNGRKKCADLNVTDRNTSPFSSSLTTTGCWSHSMCWCNVVFTNAVTLQTGKNKTEKKNWADRWNKAL